MTDYPDNPGKEKREKQTKKRAGHCHDYFIKRRNPR